MSFTRSSNISSTPRLTKHISSKLQVRSDSQGDNTTTQLVRSLESQQTTPAQSNQLNVAPQLLPRKTGNSKEQAIVQSMKAAFQKLSPQDQAQVQKYMQGIDTVEVKSPVRSIKQKSLHLRIHSNHGHERFVGLTGLELLDNDEKPIQVTGVSADVDSDKLISNLINGHNCTIDESKMWHTKYTAFPINIRIYYESDKLHAVKVWNYNKNRPELNKGVLKLEILQNDQQIWIGELKKGVAHTYSDFGYNITLKQNQFCQSMQSMNSKRSDDNRETNLSKNSSKYTRPKIISNPFAFDEEKKVQRKVETVVEPQSVKTKPSGIKCFSKNPIMMFQKQLTEEDQTPNSQQRRGVAHIAAGIVTTRTKRITIPETPIGSKLVLRILNNWGDQYHVGLTGVELFSCDGDSIQPTRVSGFFQNPERLFDGQYLTQDEKYMDLGRIGKSMEVKFEFPEQKISMIRVWNYNRGRIYNSKCVRQLEILLDGDQIFVGEIKKANGGCGVENAEYIMFTQNERILKSIEDKDWLNRMHESQQKQQRHILEETTKIIRPDTATFNKQPKRQTSLKFNQVSTAPQSSHHVKHESQNNHQIEIATEPKVPPQQQITKKSFSYQSYRPKTLSFVTVKVLKIAILRNWGDRQLVGLDRIDLQDKYERNLEVKQYIINCSQYKSVKSATDRWTSPNGVVEIIFKFKEPVALSRILIWNYNQKDELERGVQLIAIYGDDSLLTTQQGVYLKKGTGLCEQEPTKINLPCKIQIYPIFTNLQFESYCYNQYYETLELPQGTKLSMKLISTWGDAHYIGLNGIEIFNHSGELLAPTFYAQPNSVRELPQMEMDIRTPDKLMNGVNQTLDPRNMWLAPFQNSHTQRLISDTNSSLFDHVPCQINQLVFSFEWPSQISAISIYNYSKTPERGVREIEISMDDHILYRGYLNISTLVDTPRGLQGDNKTSVVFTRDERILEQVRMVAIRDSMVANETILINEQVTENTIRNNYMRKPRMGYGSMDRPNTKQIF